MLHHGLNLLSSAWPTVIHPFNDANNIPEVDERPAHEFSLAFAFLQGGRYKPCSKTNNLIIK